MSKKNTVFISITTPVTIRNFLTIQSGVFERLKNTPDTRIVLCVPVQACEKMREDFESECVIVEPIAVSFRKNLFQTIGTFFTSYLNFTNLQWLEASMGVRNDVPASGGRRFLNPFKILIARSFGRLRWVRTTLAPAIDDYVFPERPYRELFETYKPDVLFVTDIFGLHGRNLLREAKRTGVPSIGMTASWDHFPKRFEPRKPDMLLVWNEALRQEAVELQNYTPERIHVVGVPQYDIFADETLIIPRAKFFKRLGLDPDKKLVSFFSSSKRAPDDGDIADMLLQWMRKDILVSPSQLFIRPYPGVPSDHEKFDRFNDEAGVYVDWVPLKKIFGDAAHGWYPEHESVIAMMNVFYHSDIVASTYSSACIEASIFDTPAININFDGYKTRPLRESVKRGKWKSHFQHVFATGGVRNVGSPDEFLAALNEFLKNPKANLANQRKLRDTMCYCIDGKASERITKIICTYSN